MECIFGLTVRLTIELGDRYEGEWKNCLKHGNGTDIFSNGDVYIGQYKFGNIPLTSKVNRVGMDSMHGRMGVRIQVNSRMDLKMVLVNTERVSKLIRICMKESI